MFEELKQKIAQENIEKIKKTQKMIEGGDQSSNQYDSEDFSSDGQFSQRVQIFKMLIQERPKNKILSKSVKQYRNQGQYVQRLKLTQQKIKMEKQLYQKEVDLLTTKHENQREAYKTEIEKLKCVIERQIKEQGLISRLKKDNRQLQDLQTKSQEISQNLLHQNTQLKKQIFKLKNLLKQRQEREANIQAKKHIESQIQIKLKEQVLTYQKEKQIDVQRRKQLEITISRLKSQNQQLIRERDRHKMESDFQKTQISQRYMLQITKVEEQNSELKKRNQKLEQSFIQHLTQTSVNLQQTLKAPPQRASKNSTIYLQQSPIKARSKSRQRVRIAPEEQDPQKGSPVQCNCSGQLVRLRAKLQQANLKIVELLYQKCHVYGRR